MKFLWQKALRSVLFLGLVGLSTTPYLFAAQSPDFETAAIGQRDQLAELEKDLSIRGKEKVFKERLEGVSYAEVLKDPDNFELNYRYAQQQVREGNLLGAAGTLERILLVNPELAQIRLFYIIVLFRLDNLLEAKAEIEKIKTYPMPDQLRTELKIYEREIKKRQKYTRYSLSQSVGWQMDTNKNAAPSSKRRLFFELPIGISGTGTKQRDTSFINVTSFDVVHDLGTQAGHELFGNFTYYIGEQTLVDSLDLQSFSYNLGMTYKTKWFHFSPSFASSVVDLSRQLFQRTQSANLKLSKDFKRFDLYATSKLERHDYRRINENLAAPQRNGRLINGELGARWKMSANMQLLGTIGYENKSAKSDFEGYERLSLGLAHTMLLWRGHFLINGADVNFDYYDEPEVAVAGRFRRDKTFRYRTTYGLGMGSLPLLDQLPSYIKDIVLTATYELFRSSSDITNFSYTNHKFQTMATKRLEF